MNQQEAQLLPENAGHPYRVVAIQGAQAVMFQRAPQEFTTVQSAADADRALGDPGNTQHCGLCNEFFGTQAFIRHAPSCIRANAPKFEANRDRIPPYADQKRFRTVSGSNHGRAR